MPSSKETGSHNHAKKLHANKINRNFTRNICHSINCLGFVTYATKWSIYICHTFRTSCPISAALYVRRYVTETSTHSRMRRSWGQSYRASVMAPQCSNDYNNITLYTQRFYIKDQLKMKGAQALILNFFITCYKTWCQYRLFKFVITKIIIFILSISVSLHWRKHTDRIKLFHSLLSS